MLGTHAGASAYFLVPYAATSRRRLIARIDRALSEVDVTPPSLVVLSTPKQAARDGAWVFALGAAADEDRVLGRGFFLEYLSEEVPTAFIGRDPSADEEVFHLRTGQRASSLYLVSRGTLLGGWVDDITIDYPQRSRPEAVNGWSAATIGRKQTGLGAGGRTLEGADFLAVGKRWLGLAPDGLRRVAPGSFCNLIRPGLEPNQDDYPTRASAAAAASSAAAVKAAPVARELDHHQSTELANQVRTFLRGEGGTPEAALATIDRLLRSFPNVQNHMLRASLLERSGDLVAREGSLRAAHEQGLAAPGRPSVHNSNVVEPTSKLAAYLIATQRAAEAVALIDRALPLLSPEHLPPLLALRAKAI